MNQEISFCLKRLREQFSIDEERLKRFRERAVELGRVDEALEELGLKREQLFGVSAKPLMNQSQRSRDQQGAQKRDGAMKQPASFQRRLRTGPEAERSASKSSEVDKLIGLLLDISERFELFEEIAHGAMGRIQAGWDRHLGRPVAIKMLRNDRARDVVRMRFLEEAQVTGQLQHPSIITVYELGRIQGDVAFVMKRVDGQSLKALIRTLKRRDPVMLERFPLKRRLQSALSGGRFRAQQRGRSPRY